MTGWTSGDASNSWYDGNTDAVYAGDVPAGNYHFDVTEFSGSTTVKKLTEHW
ncbi:hypothetical protein GUY44_08590 [Pimelobacter simplex]|uniref:Uncharacterized protein n=1 Tax=Nocardioides simplex TaxID=2045 RepID=A0A0C5XFP6_NOCSI|nr:hypothetical protein [Pimelobacter simplex]AJR17986.1 hypothetical protein KR76_00006 [Pimelobacter simplex]MCG8150533.1 hypothetical protein [Pimelobacter simplex]GEB15056.1 hypothetical protein NSI01_33710 [Pimelobacter simplex]SFM87046.1 hypothetical protein SAMN05421671_3881 [Pimelobacter simplex]